MGDKRAFFELLQMTVGTRDSLEHLPASSEEWKSLFYAFSDHSLVGVSFPSVDKLFSQTDIPLQVHLSWEKAARDVRRRSQRHLEASREVYHSLQADGFRCCLLKGQASAARYPDPLLRKNGDIDLWVEGPRQRIMDYLKSRYQLYKTRYIHADVKMREDFRVEVHFTPSWMFSPFANRRLQRWFTSHAEEQFSHLDQEGDLCVPTVRFDGVYLLLHIYRHLLEEGIGFRQLMDYYYLLISLDEEDRKTIVQDLRHLGLMRFAGALMDVLEQAFGLQRSQMLCPPSRHLGGILLDAILQSGNFGRIDPVFDNPESRKEGAMAHGWRKIKRNMHFLLLCPTEVLWMPFFVTWQYFWRLKNGFLYKGR